MGRRDLERTRLSWHHGVVVDQSVRGCDEVAGCGLEGDDGHHVLEPLIRDVLDLALGNRPAQPKTLRAELASSRRMSPPPCVIRFFLNTLESMTRKDGLSTMPKLIIERREGGQRLYFLDFQEDEEIPRDGTIVDLATMGLLGRGSGRVLHLAGQRCELMPTETLVSLSGKELTHVATPER